MRILATALMLTTAAPALADQVTAKDGAPVIAWYLAESATVDKTIDNWGDPLLTINQYGQEFQIYFYGCEGGAGCTAIQFYSGYATEGSVRQATINAWNAENRYLRAYLSDTGNTRIEFDVFLGGDGITGDDFAAINGIWQGGVRDFKAHIGW